MTYKRHKMKCSWLLWTFSWFGWECAMYVYNPYA